MIPKAAIVRRGSLPSVFVLNGDERVSLRVVRTGGELADDKIAVLAGLRIGERVVVNPPAGIRSGWSPGGERLARD